ncbi:hypothetical protein AA0Z99_11055 [Agrococcus sp. 1P02AA]|uniref:hypothetical protein n=1 Tax=Agrococcus sp. 1P02AA TaxID=3132259 RepID=UPI0039A5BE64
MLGRLGSGLALASIAMLLLAGCAPEEPTTEEVRPQVEEAFDGFQELVAEQLSTRQIDASGLEEYATPEVAQTWSSDLQRLLESGYTSSGRPTLTNVVVLGESSGVLTTQLCTDGSAIETIDAEGNTIAPAELVAWDAEFALTEGGDRYLLASLEPIAEDEVCVR